MDPHARQEQIEQVRRFNRTVTERVGVLHDRYLGRDRPIGEARLLWEIGERATGETVEGVEGGRGYGDGHGYG